MAVCSFGGFMWWKSRDVEYVESRKSGLYHAWLVANQQMPQWVAPVSVLVGIVGMTFITLYVTLFG